MTNSSEKIYFQDDKNVSPKKHPILNIFGFQALTSQSTQSLSGEACDHALAPAHALINLHVRKFVRSNKYDKHCIIRTKIVFTIILIMKILIFIKNLRNKNLHNNKLNSGLEIRVHFLKLSLKFRYFWNIPRGVTREKYSGIIVEISFSHVYNFIREILVNEIKISFWNY